MQEVLMFYSDYTANNESVKLAYQRVCEAFPEQADRARDMVIDYLARYDRHRMRVFLGEVADKYADGLALENAHLLISSMLFEQDRGNPEADDITIDSFAPTLPIQGLRFLSHH